MTNQEFKTLGSQLLNFIETGEKTQTSYKNFLNDMKSFIIEVNKRRFWEDVEEVSKNFMQCMSECPHCDNCEYAREEYDTCHERLLQDIWRVWHELIRRAKE